MISTSLFGRRLAATLVVGLFATTLAACGGGSGGGGGGGTSYSGSTSKALVTEENKDEAAGAGIEGSMAAISGESIPEAPLAAEIRRPVLADAGTVARLQALVNDTLARIEALPDSATGADFSIPGQCGGSVSFTSRGDTTTLNYNNFCVEDDEGEVRTSGRAITREREDGYQITYRDFVIRYSDGTVERIPDMTLTCGELGCVTSSDFVGSDGETYRIENAEVIDNLDGSFDLSLRVYDGDLGYLDIQAEGIVLCDNGIAAGTITITNAGPGGEDVQITFSGCNAYTINIIYTT